MQVAIVQRGKFATFELLSRTFADNPNVRVVWDRRVRDRRQTAAPVAADQRRRDRRARPSASWDQCQYVVVNATDDPPADASRPAHLPSAARATTDEHD